MLLGSSLDPFVESLSLAVVVQTWVGVGAVERKLVVELVGHMRSSYFCFAKTKILIKINMKLVKGN